jgi:hypothetical protein
LQDLVTILRDPMMRTILAIVAICVTVGLFLTGRRRKRLSYSLSDTRVLGVHEAVNPSRVQILFDGAAVTEVRLLIITVNNWGNEPIRVDDFERPLRFSWPEPARILTAEVAEVSPESLQPTINTGVSEIVVDPLLLNPGDWLRIKILINQVTKISVDARVVGLKRITVASSIGTSDKKFRALMAMLVGAFLTLLVTLAGENWGLWVANGRVEKAISVVLFLGVMIFLYEQLRSAVLDLISSLKHKDGPK